MDDVLKKRQQLQELTVFSESRRIFRKIYEKEAGYNHYNPRVENEIIPQK